MNTILDSGHSWLLSSIDYEDLSLSVVLVELIKASKPEPKSEKMPIEGAYRVAPEDNGRLVRIYFDKFITYHVINESCDRGAPGTEYESKGFLSVVSKSPYLDVIEEQYGWYQDIIGKSKLYNIWSENEIIEVYSSDDPKIEALS